MSKNKEDVCPCCGNNTFSNIPVYLEGTPIEGKACHACNKVFITIVTTEHKQEEKCEYQKDEYCHNNYDKWENVLYCMKENCSLYVHNQPKADSDEIREAFDKEYLVSFETMKWAHEEIYKVFTWYHNGYKTAHKTQQSVIDEAVELLKGCFYTELMGQESETKEEIKAFLCSIEDKKESL